MKRNTTKKSAAANTKKPAASKPEASFFHKKASGKGTGKKQSISSTQASIPYKAMYRDGICHGKDGRFSKTVRFFDINYQLAQTEDKANIFENWCDFLNYFDSSIHFQLSFINQHINFLEYQKMIDIPDCGDDFDHIRKEYTQMLQDQLAKGNNGLLKVKYITFSIEAPNYADAKQRLERVEADIMANFKVMGVRAESLNGYDRLKIMHDTFHTDTREPFRFSYDLLTESGLNTKDFIAPTSFNFSQGRYFRMGSCVGAVSYLQILAPELTDKLLAQFLDIDSDLILTLHIHSLDQTKAIKNVKSKITDLDRMKMEEQKKAVRSGYDMDILPSDLLTFGTEAKRLLEDLQSRNERMFLVTVVLLMTSPTKKKLEGDIFQASSIAQQANCTLRRLDYRQEAGLMSSLPLAMNQIPIERGLTTSSTAIFVPFTTQELFQNGEALYYGLNALSNNMIMVDRRKLKNPNGLILGTPGSGKSFSAKLHNIDLSLPPSGQKVQKDRNTKEVEAESTAYVVCQHFGIDTSDYSFGYVATWSQNKELPELKSSLDTIRRTAASIINTMEEKLTELQLAQEKEQNQDQIPQSNTRSMAEEEIKDFTYEQYKSKLQQSPIPDIEPYLADFERLYAEGQLDNLKPTPEQQQITEEPALSSATVIDSHDPDTPSRLAADLDAFISSYDPYMSKSALPDLTEDIAGGTAVYLKEWLNTIIQDEEDFRPQAQELLRRMDSFPPEPDPEEAAFELNGHYLYLQTASDNSWDYTYYDAFLNVADCHPKRPSVPRSAVSV